MIVAIISGHFYLAKFSTPASTAISPLPVKTARYQDFHLEIPKLNINAPIIADVDGDNKDAYFKALENGVAHFAGTYKPGENGLIFIFGHSSFYAWSTGHYKEIFKNLNDLELEDEIIIWQNQKEYKYKVTEKKLVIPTDTSSLKPTNFEQLTLMTCWPPKKTEKRLIINAKPYQ